MTGDHTGGHGAMFTLSPPLSVISDVIIVILWVNIGDILIHHEQVPSSIPSLYPEEYKKKDYRQENVFDEINPGEYVICDHDLTSHDKCLCMLAPDRIAQCHNVSPRL